MVVIVGVGLLVVVTGGLVGGLEDEDAVALDAVDVSFVDVDSAVGVVTFVAEDTFSTVVVLFVVVDVAVEALVVLLPLTVVEFVMITDVVASIDAFVVIVVVAVVLVV